MHIPVQVQAGEPKEIVNRGLTMAHRTLTKVTSRGNPQSKRQEESPDESSAVCGLAH